MRRAVSFVVVALFSCLSIAAVVLPPAVLVWVFWPGFFREFAFLILVLSLLLGHPSVEEAILRKGMGARDLSARQSDVLARIAVPLSRSLRVPSRLRVLAVPGSRHEAGVLGASVLFLSEPMFDLPSEQLAGVIAHEFSHIDGRHGFFGAAEMVLRQSVRALSATAAALSLANPVAFFLLGPLLLLWTLLCLPAILVRPLVAPARHWMEFSADSSAAAAGFGAGLGEYLRSRLSGGVRDFLPSFSHPPLRWRLRRLDRAAGALYSSEG